MSESGPEKLPDVREWSFGPFKCPGGRDTLPDVPVGWEALPDMRELLGGPLETWGGPPGSSGASPEVRDWSGHPPR